jgi:hypothetical protein
MVKDAGQMVEYAILPDAMPFSIPEYYLDHDTHAK